MPQMQNSEILASYKKKVSDIDAAIENFKSLALLDAE